MFLSCNINGQSFVTLSAMASPLDRNFYLRLIYAGVLKLVLLSLKEFYVIWPCFRKVAPVACHGFMILKYSLHSWAYGLGHVTYKTLLNLCRKPRFVCHGVKFSRLPFKLACKLSYELSIEGL